MTERAVTQHTLQCFVRGGLLISDEPTLERRELSEITEIEEFMTCKVFSTGETAAEQRFSPPSSELPSDDEILFVGKSRSSEQQNNQTEQSRGINHREDTLGGKQVKLSTMLPTGLNKASTTSGLRADGNRTRQSGKDRSSKKRGEKKHHRHKQMESSEDDDIAYDYIENMRIDMDSELPSELLTQFANRDLDIGEGLESTLQGPGRVRPAYHSNDWSAATWDPSYKRGADPALSGRKGPVINTLIPGPGESVPFELTERGQRKKERLKRARKLYTMASPTTDNEENELHIDASFSFNSTDIRKTKSSAPHVCKSSKQGTGSPVQEEDTSDGITGQDAIEALIDAMDADDEEEFKASNDATDTSEDESSTDYINDIDDSDSVGLAEILPGDPYDGFDVMDHSRASLHLPKSNRKSKKGRLTRAPQVSDDDIQTILNNAWEADRISKKTRKIERERLRKEGLLGNTRDSNMTGDDLKQKYPNGMTLYDITSELREFCLSRAEQLSLPPLDASARKIIHTACHKLGCKSKSFGKGNLRFLVVLKTKKTTGFDPNAFASLSKTRRQYFARTDAKQLTRTTPRPSGGASFTSVRTLAGMKVGEGAPELGSAKGSAKAKAMMEKMGWSTGQGLGHGSNKGRLDPVEHIVRYSRAGLG